MPIGLTFSILLHALVLLVMVFGLPWFQRERPEPAGTVPVQVITEAELAELTASTEPPPPEPPVEPTPVVEPDAPPPPEPPPAPPEPPPEPPPPEPPPLPEPPEVAELPEPRAPEPPPEAEPAPEPPPPEPKPEPEPPPPEPEPPPPEPEPPPPEPEPEPPEEEVAEAPPEPEPEPEPPPDPMAAMLERLQNQPPQEQAERTTTETLTPVRLAAGEENAVREAIRPCWNVDQSSTEIPPVRVRVTLNQDRTVQSAEVMDAGRFNSDVSFRTAAERAVRAARNPRCQPWPLPAEKWPQWRVIEFNFDPESVF